MSRNHFRLFLIFTFCGIAAAGALWFPGRVPSDHAVAADAETVSLTIGSKAPAIDIEHWVQDGKGFFQPVKNFNSGKVYVVEFWATWCGPCVSSMPHLASLQEKYRGRGVQVVSISDEPLETVDEFLKRETETQTGDKTTFAEITSAYCLTTDPDRSVYTDYMDAAQQQGIPTAFIVGKSGLVEWIGHPMSMDEPLEQIVTDVWDRAAYAKTLEAERRFEEIGEQINRLAGTGKFDEALRVIDSELKTDCPAEIRERWVSILQRVKLAGGMVDQEVMDYFKQELINSKGSAIGVAQIGGMLYQASRDQKGLDELLTASITAITSEVDNADPQIKPFLLDTLAHLYEATGNLAAAIKTQQQAVDSAEGRAAQRLSRYLDELKAQ